MYVWNFEKLRKYLKDCGIVITGDTVLKARRNFKGLLHLPVTFETARTISNYSNKKRKTLN